MDNIISLQGKGIFTSEEIGPVPSGDNFSIAVPANELWLPVGLTCFLSTDANVADREFTHRFRDNNTNVLSFITANIRQKASENFIYSVGIGVSTKFEKLRSPTFDYGVEMQMPEGFYLLPNYVWQIVLHNIQGGDTWDNTVFNYIRFNYNL